MPKYWNPLFKNSSGLVADPKFNEFFTEDEQNGLILSIINGDESHLIGLLEDIKKDAQKLNCFSQGLITVLLHQICVNRFCSRDIIHRNIIPMIKKLQENGCNLSFQYAWWASAEFLNIYSQERRFMFLQALKEMQFSFPHLQGCSILHAAILSDPVSWQYFVSLALECGVDVNQLHPLYGSALHSCIANEGFSVDGKWHSLWLMEQLAKTDFDWNSRDGENKTPLILACKMAFLHQDEVLFLLQLKQERKINIDVNCQDSNGCTALYYACLYGMPKVVEKLVELGANIDCVDNNGKTPKDYAHFSSEETAAVLRSIHINPSRWECAPSNQLTSITGFYEKDQFGAYVDLIVDTDAKMYTDLYARFIELLNDVVMPPSTIFMEGDKYKDCCKKYMFDQIRKFSYKSILDGCTNPDYRKAAVTFLKPLKPESSDVRLFSKEKKRSTRMKKHHTQPPAPAPSKN